MLDILGKRYLFFIISALLIVPGLVILAIWGMPMSIDFQGGTLLDVSFSSGKSPAPADVINLYNEMGITEAVVSTSGADELLIRSSFMDETALNNVVAALGKLNGDTVTVRRSDSVGPTIGREVTTRAGVAVGIAALL
jgi:preprotein translocase subunit SecF